MASADFRFGEFLLLLSNVLINAAGLNCPVANKDSSEPAAMQVQPVVFFAPQRLPFILSPPERRLTVPCISDAGESNVAQASPLRARNRQEKLAENPIQKFAFIRFRLGDLSTTIPTETGRPVWPSRSFQRVIHYAC